MIKFTLGFLAAAVLAIGAYFYLTPRQAAPPQPDTASENSLAGTTATNTQPVADSTKTVIGTSVKGNEIVAYHFGEGSKNVLFVGGIHGGYEWNTALLAYEIMDELKKNPNIIPTGVRVTIIPVLNPDGLAIVAGTSSRFAASDVSTSKSVQVSGRFNANTVDLNRNFDCDWKEAGTWQNTRVSGGKSAFSEPESIAMKSYIESLKPDAVVVWYSAAGGVYSSSCHDGVLPQTSALTALYAKAASYPAHEVFNYYDITGDMVNWLAKIKIPAISVLLTNHTDIELSKNRAGVQAVLEYISK